MWKMSNIVTQNNKAKRRRLVSNLMADQRSPSSDPSSDQGSGSNFLVRSNNSDFSGRQVRIFDQLDNLAEQYDRDVIARHDPPPQEEDDMKEPDDGFFVVPTRRPPPRRRFPTRCIGNNKDRHYKPPDHKMHPEKWTRYSLDDVTEDQMSDKSNSEAAFQFLTGNKLPSSTICAQPTCDVKNVNVPFGKRKIHESEAEESPRSSTSSGKWVMPEYVVGCKAHKRPTVAKADSSVSSQVTLAHLEVPDTATEKSQLKESVEGDREAFKVPKKSKNRGNIRQRDTDIET